eukprot:3847260-Rhodomonas_salina.1
MAQEYAEQDPELLAMVPPLPTRCPAMFLPGRRTQEATRAGRGGRGGGREGGREGVPAAPSARDHFMDWRCHVRARLPPALGAAGGGGEREGRRGDRHRSRALLAAYPRAMVLR